MNGPAQVLPDSAFRRAFRPRSLLAVSVLSLAGAVIAAPAAAEDGPISAASDAACVLDATGAPHCWNRTAMMTPVQDRFISIASSEANYFHCGLRGDGTIRCWGHDLGQPISSPPGSGYVSVDAGYKHYCAINGNGTASCWGSNTHGQTNVPAGATFISISAGQLHTCGVKTDGTVQCWGDIQYGVSNAPSGSLLRFKKAGAGFDFSCALRSDGAAICWGNNFADIVSSAPRNLKTLSVGKHHACGLSSENYAVCWGYNGFGAAAAPAWIKFKSVTAGDFFSCGQRADGSVQCWGGIYHSPALSNTGRTSVYAGGRHSCQLNSSGALECWGSNEYGEASAPSGTFLDAGTGKQHSCAVTTSGMATCWGDDSLGQLDNSLVQLQGLSVGSYTNCALRNGQTFCWGLNNYGQAAPPSTSLVRQVASGFVHGCSLTERGTLACWGHNSDGQVSPPTGTYKAVSSGDYHSCALQGDGQIDCWGRNSDGQAASPEGTFRALSAGAFHNCAISTNGSLQCWGWNDAGQTSAPDGTFVSVSSGALHSCAVREDGSRICWGDSSFGQSISIQPQTLTAAGVGSSYLANLTLTAAGYTAQTPVFLVTDGTLPPGMSLSADGTLSGAPNAPGMYTFEVEAEDARGFSAERSYSLLVEQPDTTPPVITPSVSGTLGDNGWHTGDATITWSVSDPDSPVTLTTGCETSQVITDGDAQAFTCEATSSGGTSRETVMVKRDATPPSLAPTATPNPALLNAMVEAAPNAADATAGIASMSCSAIDTSTVGSKAVTCTAVDNAGNQNSANLSVDVRYAFSGFSSPVDNPQVVNVVKAGRAIPLKWRLLDDGGQPYISLTRASISASAMSCSSGATQDTVEETATGSSGLQNLGDGYYQINWSSPKGYASSCRKLLLDLGDGLKREALFQFK